MYELAGCLSPYLKSQRVYGSWNNFLPISGPKQRCGVGVPVTGGDTVAQTANGDVPNREILVSFIEVSLTDVEFGSPLFNLSSLQDQNVHKF